MANGPYYVDQALTTMSQAYRNANESFKAEKLLPVVPVDAKTGKYWQYDKNNNKKPISTLRTGRAKTNEVTYGKSLQNFGPLEEHALKDFITRDELDMQKVPLSVELDTANFLYDQMQIDKEVTAATLLQNTTVIYQNANPTTQWNAATGAGHPFLDIASGINTMKLSAFRAPNTIFMGYPVWLQLMNHPDLLDRVKYSQLGVLTTELFRTLFADNGITTVHVCDAVYDSAAEGLAATNGYIWGKHLWLAYINPSPQLRDFNSGFTLQLKNGKEVSTMQEWDPDGKWIKSKDYYQQFIVGAEGYYMLTNVVA